MSNLAAITLIHLYFDSLASAGTFQELGSAELVAKYLGVAYGILASMLATGIIDFDTYKAWQG